MSTLSRAPICLLTREYRKPFVVPSESEGRIVFDIPRHRVYMGFTQDWPRMNAMPEWFTVEPDDEQRYVVENVDASSNQDYTGKSLAAGLPVKLEANKPLRLIVRPLAP